MAVRRSNIDVSRQADVQGHRQQNDILLDGGVQALGALSAIAKLGFKALRSTERRGSRRAQQLPAARQRDSAHQRAQALFRWLLRACLLYELSSWCRPFPCEPLPLCDIC